MLFRGALLLLAQPTWSLPAWVRSQVRRGQAARDDRTQVGWIGTLTAGEVCWSDANAVVGVSCFPDGFITTTNLNESSLEAGLAACQDLCTRVPNCSSVYFGRCGNMDPTCGDEEHYDPAVREMYPDLRVLYPETQHCAFCNAEMVLVPEGRGTGGTTYGDDHWNWSQMVPCETS